MRITNSMAGQQDIYFDNSSTTKPSEAVIAVMEKTLREDYGNPSSLHRKGVEAEKYISHAREVIASVLKVNPKEILFTSGGTEANNQAILGTAAANYRRGRRILTTAMEHPAVSEPLKMLKRFGFEIDTIPVDHAGRIDPAEVEARLTPDTILVSVMMVNNEIGAVTPVREIAGLIRKYSPEALFHVDAIQAFGKMRIFPKDLDIDLMSVSGHKLHGPKGVGFLYVRSKAHIVPLLYGGGQQEGMRSGTENVPGIAGLGEAVREAYEDFDEKQDRLYALKMRMEEGLSGLEDVVIHGLRGREGAPHIVHAAFPGVGAEVLLHALEDRGIYVSAGSACSTHKRSASPTMTAIGAAKEEVTSSVRFSFSELNTTEEVDRTLEVLREILPALRRYRRH